MSEVFNVNEEVRVLPDVVTELLARIGENELLYHGVASGVMPLKEYEHDLKRIDWWRDEERQMVAELEGEPRRLVLDEILGWQWYNSEGPEEAQWPNESLPISYGCSTHEAESFMHRMFDRLFTGEPQE